MQHADRHPARLLVAALLLGVAVTIAVSAKRTQPQSANFGYVPDPVGARAFLGQLAEPFFAQAGADCMAKARGVDTFLYRPMYRAHQARYGKPFVVGRQLNGSCVAWGAMHAVFCQESVAWSLGESAEPPFMPSTEAIYGGARCQAMGRSFAGWSDGATGFGAAKWLKTWGVIYRQKFADLGVDLTVYSGDLERTWGAYGARKAPCQHVVAVRTWDELAAALEAGFPVTLASSQGFTSKLGPSGIMEASGTWYHQMVAIGVRYRSNGSPDDCVLILNSWGPAWCQPYDNRWPDDMPPGSFWARRRVVEGMLGDAWAIGSVKNGFQWRDIHNGNWMQPAPPEMRPPQPDELFDPVPAVLSLGL
jgi:hypothetical protein